MPEKYRRYFLKTKEVKSLLRKVSKKLKIDVEQIFDVKVNVELVETDFAGILLINSRPLLFKVEESIFPTLIFNEIVASAPKVVVDMGAVPHVCNGANVMAPGIVRFEGNFRKDDFVFVVDERHGKPVAIGEVVYDVEAAKKATQGVVVKNTHFVGDKIWNFIKTLKSK